MEQNRTQYMYSLRRLKAPSTCQEASLKINNELSGEMTIHNKDKTYKKGEVKREI